MPYNNIKKEWDGIVFEIIADRKLPPDKSIYQKENINKHSLSAFNKVLYDENTDQLASSDFRFYFIVYFRHENKILGEMEFTYLMNDKLFL